ncbi:hypothetical protein Ahy_B04g071352 [Arachis hypogaea]|uniref:SWIM-type domain-containing protein n=1 Tax=Arachis hypogaea TaxID=3818 RepID=A0A444ZKH9_ARAHY|nr:hypothetical protein Ahy_B04g071352 [Arachis hypogaea]
MVAAMEKNKERILKMHITHCDRRASMFVVEELEPFKGWSQGSFHVRLMQGTCDCGLFQSLHFPCRHRFPFVPPQVSNRVYMFIQYTSKRLCSRSMRWSFRRYQTKCYGRSGT